MHQMLPKSKQNSQYLQCISCVHFTGNRAAASSRATKLHISYTNRDNQPFKLLLGTKTRIPAEIEQGDTVETKKHAIVR